MLEQQTTEASARMVQLTGTAEMVIGRAAMQVTASQVLLHGKRDTWLAELCAGSECVKNHEIERAPRSA